MTPQQAQLIIDNPNLSSAALSRFTGLSKNTIARNRDKPPWTHRGYGIPYVTQHRANDGIYLTIRHREQNIANGKLDYILENLDRLIYCLENNGGDLPPTFEESIFSNLEFKGNESAN